MKKWIWVFILQLMVLNTLKAQENSLFWKIEKKGYATSYLLGTMHSNDPRILATQEKILPYLKKVKAYAGEIIFKESDKLAIFKYLIEKDPNKQAGNLLNEEEMNMCKEKIKENLGPGLENLLPKMSPYMISILLLSPNDYSGENANLFLDVFLQEHAKKLGKELISLESIESQMSYIQKIDPIVQKEYLLEVILFEPNAFDEDLEKMITWYLNNDLNQLYTWVKEETINDPLINYDFLEGRNLIQKDNMILSMKKQATFTAVGAAHLPGENGIISLLRKEGFTITPL